MLSFIFSPHFYLTHTQGEVRQSLGDVAVVLSLEWMISCQECMFQSIH